MMVSLKRPSLPALLLGLVPFAAMCFSVSAWDRIHPMILGLPFNLFWLVLWIVLTPLCMWGAYRVEMPPTHDAAPSVSAGTPRPHNKDGPSA